MQKIRYVALALALLSPVVSTAAFADDKPAAAEGADAKKPKKHKKAAAKKAGEAEGAAKKETKAAK